MVTGLILGFVVAYCFGPFIVTGVEGRSTPLSVQTPLLHDLLKDYHHLARPVKNQNESVSVYFRLIPTRIEGLDAGSGVLTFITWMHMDWMDEYLTWDPSQYNGTDSVAIPADRLWSPNIQLNNSVDPPQGNKLAMLYESGSSLGIVDPRRFRSTCPVDLTFFPFDTQKCKLVFSSWSYDGSKVNLTGKEGPLKSKRFKDDGEFILINSSAVRNVRAQDCCPNQPLIDITVELTLRRRASLYTHLFVVPTVVTFLVPFVFLLPLDSREKVILGIGILISYILMFGQIESFIPRAYPRIPILGVFCMIHIVFVCSSLAFSVVLHNFWSNENRTQGLPAWLKFLVDRCSPIVRVRRNDFLSPETKETISLMKNPHDSISDEMVQKLSRLTAIAEWRQLAVTLDRILFVKFLLSVFIMAMIVLCYN